MVDIISEASIMASYMVSPRQGYLDQVYHVFAYLKLHHNCEIVFDPTETEINLSDFSEKDWSTSYGAKEVLSTNTPEPRGQGFVIRAFVDSDHAGLELTRRSPTGYIIFLNNAPIYCFFKKQSSIQTSSFCSEFLVLKECCEYLRGLRYKLRMMGISVDHPSFIYGDNKSVLVNSSVPTSVLQKKSSSIAYHFVREGVAAKEWMVVTYIFTHDNIDDLLKSRSQVVKGVQDLLASSCII